MATNRLQVTELDFDTIKTNLKNFLKSQDQFQDYDFDGAGLSVLLDILAYNTHYNAYYLNMVANEAFLDTAVIRDSVVSHAKTLGYVPYSTTAASATINLTFQSTTSDADTLTLPRGFNFKSDLVDDVSYNFVILDDTTVTKANSNFYFENLKIYEGTLTTYNFNYNETTNPKAIFKIPDVNIDTRSIKVTVVNSLSNSSIEVYNLSTDILDATSNSNVFFLQEGRNSNYEIYFGNNILGKKLIDGSIVSVSYLITNGSLGNKINGFSLSSTPNKPYIFANIDTVDVSSGGADKESIDSIKFSAPQQYATQNRLVTKKDYESYIQAKYPNISSLSVWGGEDEVPSVYGKVFISLKPRDNYFLSQTEKQRIIDEIVTPKSILAISAEIRDPEYLYIILNNKVTYDPKKTTLTETSLIDAVRQAILSYKNINLDKFNAIFALSRLQDQIDSVDTNSISGSETIVRLQKRVAPELGVSANYTVTFGVPLKRGTLTDKFTTSEFIAVDSAGIRRTAVIEEVPQSFTGISSIEIINAGYGYTSTPTVTITGDGIGATAEAVIRAGRIVEILITNRGSDYTRATVNISGGNGFSATASAVVDSRIGTLRTIYYDTSANRQIINSNIGEINYDTGIVTINDLKIISVSSADGLLRMTAVSEDGVIESSRSVIITIDETDTASIVTTLEKIIL